MQYIYIVSTRYRELGSSYWIDKDRAQAHADNLSLEEFLGRWWYDNDLNDNYYFTAQSVIDQEHFKKWLDIADSKHWPSKRTATPLPDWIQNEPWARDALTFISKRYYVSKEPLLE